MKIYETNLYEKNYLAESKKDFVDCTPECENAVINIFDDVKYQTVLGFGGAITEAAAYNYSKLTNDQKMMFLEKYFGENGGLSYSVCRLHINSCDFSLDVYDYLDPNDRTTESFSIERDKQYIIPMIKDIINFSKKDIFFFASPWSPPEFMKDNGSRIDGGRLKDEYKKLWALYFCKYIKAYRDEGIDIKAITIQNEPNAKQTWESCFYLAEEEKEFFEDYLVPTLDENGLSKIKIMIWDHNKERIYDRAKTILKDNKYADRIYAVAYHWYSGDHFEGLDLVYNQLHKDTFLSEFCWGMDYDKEKLAEKYAKEICEDLNHNTIAICDWNILLSESGGPYHNRTAESSSVSGVVFESKSGGCFAPVLYDNNSKELVFTPIYYYISHFARFIKSGAKRLATTKYSELLNVTAFENQDGTRVAVVINTSDNELPVKIRFKEKVCDCSVKAHSIYTFLF